MTGLITAFMSLLALVLIGQQLGQQREWEGHGRPAPGASLALMAGELVVAGGAAGFRLPLVAILWTVAFLLEAQLSCGSELYVVTRTFVDESEER